MSHSWIALSFWSPWVPALVSDVVMHLVELFMELTGSLYLGFI